MAVALAFGHAAPGQTPKDPPGAAQPTTASDKETARDLMAIGDKKRLAGDFAGAIDAYRAADALLKSSVPTVGLELAKVQTQLGQLLEARETLLRVANMPSAADEVGPWFQQARDEARELANAIKDRIPSLELEIEGPDGPFGEGAPVEVKLNGQLVPTAALKFARRVNPGELRIEAVADGYLRESRVVRLVEREQQRLKIILDACAPGAPACPGATAAPVGPNPPRAAAQPGLGLRTLASVGFSVSSSFLVVGIVSGALTIVRSKNVLATCGETCPPAKRGEIDSTLPLAHLSTASFVVAAVGMGVGLGALIASLRSARRAGSASAALIVRTVVGPGTVGLRVAF